LIRQRLVRFAWASLPALLRSPGIAPRLVRAFKKPAEAATYRRRGTLMSIAVAPPWQGKGVGRDLTLAFLEEARRRGLDAVDLTTDQLNNEAANLFYQNLGFRCTRSFVTPEGRQMNEYVMTL
jgi:ribosomal protein S18 acetylase RimI-like enzyme